VGFFVLEVVGGGVGEVTFDVEGGGADACMLAVTNSGTSFFTTPGSSGVGTLNIIGPLAIVSTQGPVHSMPFVRRPPLTRTCT
jgi:hypothetical protein